MIPKLSEICDCCGGNGSQEYLKLFDDQCFKIISGADTLGSFCLKDFIFPVDGHACLATTVKPGAETLIFDNQLVPFSPSDDLETGSSYARGLILRIFYPITDDDGNDLSIVDKNVTLVVENSNLQQNTYSLYDLFTIFTNPKSNDPQNLINKIKVINPNANYSIKVSALVIYGESI